MTPPFFDKVEIVEDDKNYFTECVACNGTGSGHTKHSVCRKCMGEGRLDWIELITGKRDRDWIKVEIPLSFISGDLITLQVDKDVEIDVTSKLNLKISGAYITSCLLRSIGTTAQITNLEADLLWRY